MGAAVASMYLLTYNRAVRATNQRAARKPAEDRRREIADAALRVIAEQGLGRFTALAIAREVGVTDGALFRHFRSKEQIVDAAIDRVEELLFDEVPPATLEPIERLGKFFLRRVAVIAEHAGISRLLVSDELARAASEVGVRRVEGLRRRSMSFVRGSLVEAEARRMLASGLGADEASVVVLGTLFALAHGPVGARREPVATLAPRIWKSLDAFLRGTSGGPTRPATRRRG
jgi:AcrR family transcriptional regulator